MPIRPRRTNYGTALTRQFSDAERQLNDEVVSYATAPPPQLGQASNMRLNYDFLDQDLKRRAAIAQDVQTRQQMVYEVSAREELARMADKEIDDEDGATSALMGITESLRNGGDLNSSIKSAIDARPDLALNDKFLGMTQSLRQNYEDTPTAELRRKKEKLDELKLTRDDFDLSTWRDAVMNDPETANSLKNNLQAKIQQEGITMENQKLRSNLEKIQMDQELDEIESKRSVWASGTASPGASEAQTAMNVNQTMAVAGAIQGLGLRGVQSYHKLANEFNGMPQITEMLSNSPWMSRRFENPEEKQDLIEAMNAMTSASTQDQKNDAAGRILAYAAEHNSYIQQAKAQKEAMRQSQTTGKLINDAFSKAEGAINKATGLDDAKAAALAFISNASAFGTVTKEEIEAAKADVNAVKDQGSLSKNRTALRAIAADFSGAAGTTRAESEAKPRDPRAEAQALMQSIRQENPEWTIDQIKTRARELSNQSLFANP